MEKPDGIPATSGCYLFRDRNGTVIYVGKAKNLASRLSSYFARTDLLTAKTASLMEMAREVEWVETRNEVEALILENQWIKAYQPRFNIRLKDDKSYPYLALDMRSPYPVPYTTRSSRQKGVKYFGPFTHVKGLRFMMNEVLQIAPLRTCTTAKYRAHERRGRACLLFDIGKCSGPCVGAIDQENYEELVVQFTKFFTGESRELEERLKIEMQEAAEARQYERAARARDGLTALLRAESEQHVVLDETSNLDVIAVSRADARAVVSCWNVRHGRVVGRDAKLYDVGFETSDEEVLERFVFTHYEGDVMPPRSILVAGNSEGLAVIAEYLSELSSSEVRLVVPRGDAQRGVLEMAQRDGTSALQRDSLRRQSDHNVRSQALIELGEVLGLSQPPYRIECFDMSHLQGTNYVGSMVVSVDGLPAKKSYRHFNVKTVLGNDDAGAMREVVGRRLRYLLADEVDPRFPRPDLIVVDGGLPQLSAALDAARAEGLEGRVEFAALAKREELLYRPGSSLPIRLDRGSEALYMLQRLRDEAHRFAITFHRSKRGESMVTSALDGIAGLGPARQKRLLEEFGSLKLLRAAPIEELMDLPWLPVTVAQALYDRLHGGPSLRLEKGSVPDE